MKTHIFKYLTLVLLCCAPFARSFAADSPEQYYGQGDYESAIRMFEQQRADGKLSTELFYNLGNAYFAGGNQGAAVLNYEKSLRMDPSNEQARNNLAYCANIVQLANESMTEGKNMDPTPAEAGFVNRLGDGVARTSSNVWAVWAVIFFVLAIAGAAAYIFVPAVVWRKVGFFGGIFFIVLCAAGIWLSIISKQHALSKDTCVLMSSEAQLKLKPDEASQSVGTPLCAGTRFKVMDNGKGADGSDWVQLYLNAEYSGWLPLSDVAIVEVPALEE